MNKIIDFFKQSNHWKHLVYGMLVGACIPSNSLCVSIYVSICVASCLELKDKLTSNYWDWVDWILTFIGVNIGFLIRVLILLLFGVENIFTII